MTGSATTSRNRLRPIGPFDLAIAAAIHAACFDDGWSTTSIAELLAMPGAFGLLAIEGNIAVGLTIVQAAGDDAELLTICVLPDCRRRGIGEELMTDLLARLAARGCKRLLLEVAEDNPIAIAFYNDHGFRRIGRRKDYYRRGRSGVDALLLARHLPNGGAAAIG